MATIDSAAPWSDGGGGCRNQRAPRIGEIQRHKAIEMERSLSTTSTNSTTNTNSSSSTSSSTTNSNGRTICKSSSSNMATHTSSNVSQQQLHPEFPQISEIQLNEPISSNASSSQFCRNNASTLDSIESLPESMETLQLSDENSEPDAGYDGDLKKTDDDENTSSDTLPTDRLDLSEHKKGTSDPADSLQKLSSPTTALVNQPQSSADSPPKNHICTPSNISYKSRLTQTTSKMMILSPTTDESPASVTTMAEDYHQSSSSLLPYPMPLIVAPSTHPLTTSYHPPIPTKPSSTEVSHCRPQHHILKTPFARLFPTKTQSLDLADDDRCDVLMMGHRSSHHNQTDDDIDGDVDEDDDESRMKTNSQASGKELIKASSVSAVEIRRTTVTDECARRNLMLHTQSQSDIPIPVMTSNQFSGTSLTGACSVGGKAIIPKIQSLESRPIYPNVPYSPYGSPYGSPRSNRRRTPLRESRRISIEQSGSFLQLNQYKLMDQIGQGSYGLVKLAYSEEDSTHYAMKILSKRKLLRKAGLMGRGPKKTTSPLDRVYREIAVLKKLDHPNVVKLVEVLDDPLEDFLYLVFELVQQGEVLSIPTENPLSEERSWSVFRDALQGLEYLHYQRIIHADLKPGNLLLGECGQVKIADLGVCNEFFGEDATMNNGSTAGTPAFRAPETLIPGQHMYSGKAADIWALGATLYALIYGNVPFVATSVPAVYEKIKNDELHFAEIPIISNDLRDLIEKMLTKDPAKRINLPQIKEHQWVTSKGTNPLPSEEENCRLVQISDEDINSVVKSIPKLDTLILIKTMLKNHSFQNPFTRASISGRAPQRGGSRLERFTRAGRSNSAPGAYHVSERQHSNENLLPSVSEGTAGSCNESSSEQSSATEG